MHNQVFLAELPAEEQGLSLGAASRLPVLIIDGRSPNPATLFRWITLGRGGVRLEAVRRGGRIVTSAPAVARFLARCGGHTSTGQKNEQLQRHLAADRRLHAAGI